MDLAFADNVALQGLVVSIALAGATVGSLAGSVLADSLGRVRAFVVDSVPLFAGAAVSAMATDVTGMLAGRFLVGLGLGLSSALVPTYIAEVAPTAVRGKLGSVNQLMIVAGILAALLVNVALPAAAWRTMFWLSAVPAALLGAGMLSGVESPKHLSSKGLTVEAEAAAATLWAGSYKAELYGDSESGAEGGGGSRAVSWSETLSGVNLKLIAIACTLFIIQQLAGINAVVYFSSQVFRDAGVANETLASAVVGLANVGGTVVATSLMETAGRTKLLTLSLLGQGACMLVLAAGFALPALQGVAGTIALTFTIAYVLAFAFGTGPVPGLLSAELLPNSIRGRGVSLAMFVHWIFNFAVGQAFLPVVSEVGVAAVYCGFAAVCLAGALFVSKVLVETQGKSTDEIYRAMSSK